MGNKRIKIENSVIRHKDLREYAILKYFLSQIILCKHLHESIMNIMLIEDEKQLENEISKAQIMDDHNKFCGRISLSYYSSLFFSYIYNCA